MSFGSLLVWRIQVRIDTMLQSSPGLDVPANSAQDIMLRETAKARRAPSQTPQTSVSMLNVKVRGLFGRYASGKSLLSKKNMAARLKFDNLHLKTKQNQQPRQDTAHKHKHLIPAVKHGRGGVRIWA